MTTSKIHQLQASYTPSEDRLLLRFNTSGNMEFRFWLTRLFVKRLWPVLLRSLEIHPQIATIDMSARPAVLEFMHQEATTHADFTAPFKESTDTSTPLGSEPILVAQARIEPHLNNADLYKVSLHPEQGNGIEVAMDTQLMHAFCKLLSDAIATADWNLELGFIQPHSNQTHSMEKGRVLH